jgi:hypothetical protein
VLVGRTFNVYECVVDLGIAKADDAEGVRQIPKLQSALRVAMGACSFEFTDKKSKSKAIPITGRGGL